jgi:hypothetical protein
MKNAITSRKAVAAFLTVGALALAVPSLSFASDHDDGISRMKTRNRNLTDLYVFREDNQTGNTADKGNLIVIMNSDPRAPGGRQEYFDPASTYDFHFSKISSADKNTRPVGSDDMDLQFKFAAPDSTGHQKVTTTLFKRAANAAAQPAGDVLTPENQFPITTTLAESKANEPTFNRFRAADGSVLSVFAGLREDPFFFDVDQFMKVRAGALGKGPKVGFRKANAAVDFTVGFNVNTIVVRIPLTFLSAGADSPIFDVWETVSVDGKQVERLARPAINEGLIETNSFLNAFNMIPPSMDLSPAAAPVLAEAAKSLTAFDMLDGKIDLPVATTVGAFLPDVMRIDTRVDIPVGKTAYNADTSGSLGMLTGGRKLQDDVMDITLSLLVAGDPTGKAVSDGVSYEGTRGNRHQGHHMLSGQGRSMGVAKFPFLAMPN